MWLTDLFNKIFKKRTNAATAMQSDVTASCSDLTPESTSYSAVTSLPEDEKIKLERESLQLGLAAGYTGRALHDILSSLNRIEAFMVTKDWFIATDKSSQLHELINSTKSILEAHDKHMIEKLKSLESSLDKLSTIAEKVQEPVRSELTHEIKQIKSELPLSPVMAKVINIVKEVGEISYKDLTIRLGYDDVSSLRSLLSRMLERTDVIEKVDKDGEKWIRVKAL